MPTTNLKQKQKKLLMYSLDCYTRKLKKTRIEELISETKEHEEQIETEVTDEIRMVELEDGTARIDIEKACGADQIEPEMIEKLGMVGK